MPLKKYYLRCPYCGSEESKWEWWLKLLLIFTNKYYYDCPVCHKKSVWINHFVLKHDTLNKEEKEYNKGGLFDERMY